MAEMGNTGVACPNCGHINAGSGNYCEQCGHYLGRGPEPVAPSGPTPALNARDIPNYLPQAILATLCCCVPFGIVSIVYAARVNGKASRGDIYGAQDASNKARMWAWISFGVGLIAGVLWLIFGVLGSVTMGRLTL